MHQRNAEREKRDAHPQARPHKVQIRSLLTATGNNQPPSFRNKHPATHHTPHIILTPHPPHHTTRDPQIKALTARTPNQTCPPRRPDLLLSGGRLRAGRVRHQRRLGGRGLRLELPERRLGALIHRGGAPAATIRVEGWSDVQDGAAPHLTSTPHPTPAPNRPQH